MKLIAIPLLLLALVSAAPATAQDKSYEEVRHLYERALLAVDDVKPAQRDYHYVDLSWDLASFGDLVLLARIPPKVTDPIFRAEVDANLALAHARTSDCPAALPLAEQAFSDRLVETLKEKSPHHRAKIALKSIVRALARCGAVGRAEEVAEISMPASGPETYRADVESTIATSLHLAGAWDEAERHMAKARRLALSSRTEGQRSAMLKTIAENQMTAGRLDEALETAIAITILPSRSSERIKPVLHPYHYARNAVLRELALRYLVRGRWDMADTALAGRTVHTGYFPDAFVALRLAQLTAMGREAALKNLANFERSLVHEGADRGLVFLASAFADVGETIRAIALLGKLYERYEARYRELQPGTVESGVVLRLLDDILKGYVLIGRPQDALDKLSEGPLVQTRSHRLKQAWGALIGYAQLNGDADLLRRINPVLQDRIDRRTIDHEAFTYLIEQRAFAEAERFIGDMAAINRPDAYSRLAREQMGVAFWDHLYDRDNRGF